MFEAVIILISFVEILSKNLVENGNTISMLMRGSKAILFYRIIKYNDFAIIVALIV